MSAAVIDGDGDETTPPSTPPPFSCCRSRVEDKDATSSWLSPFLEVFPISPSPLPLLWCTSLAALAPATVAANAPALLRKSARNCCCCRSLIAAPLPLPLLLTPPEGQEKVERASALLLLKTLWCLRTCMDCCMLLLSLPLPSPPSLPLLLLWKLLRSALDVSFKVFRPILTLTVSPGCNRNGFRMYRKVPLLLSISWSINCPLLKYKAACLPLTV